MTKRMGRLIAGAGVAALVAGVVGTSQAPVEAATATASFNVTASVTANCTITASDLAFGNYDPVSTNAATPLDQQSTVTVACTKGTSASIALDDGAHFSGGTRNMDDGGGTTLSYALYQDNGHSTVWTTASPQAYTAASKSASAQTVYGRVAAGQDVTTGSYSDSVTATITF